MMIAMMIAFAVTTTALLSVSAAEEVEHAEPSDTKTTMTAIKNPVEKGCLYSKHPKKNKKRVCNSDDPPNAAKDGICRIPDIDYMEIRIFNQNWESVIFESWILQILLSELLDVPTTIETGTADTHINFYDSLSRFEYGTNEALEALSNGISFGGDCSRAKRPKPYLLDHTVVVDGDDETTPEYEMCANFVSEVWTLDDTWLQQLIRGGWIEPPQGLGVIGRESWYITKFTALEDPTLTTHMGMVGEENRQKLADTFLRPTTWYDYCKEESSSNCTVPDNVAQRPPRDEVENDKMFLDGIYTGYFRKTAENDCETYPANCTGHIADYPCGWGSRVESQAYHLNIPLKSSGKEPNSNGYTYSQLVEMWHAANATKSNLLMYWYEPDPLYSKFVGTDAEFQKVILPPPTSECLEYKVSSIPDRCSDIFEERVGDPRAACDDLPVPLHKLITRSTYEAIYDESIPEGIRSPAYDALKLFTLSDIQLSEIMDYWLNGAGGNDDSDDPRLAICQWVDDNIDFIEQFIPSTYPRSLQDATESNGGRNMSVLWWSTILGSLSTLLVLWMACMVYKHRESRVIIYAQFEFLRFLLGGALLISLGSIVVAMPPSNITCVSGIWLINMGYTLELVPLIVKTAAINKLMTAAQTMRRLHISNSYLLGAVAIISVLVAVYLGTWSIMDTPHIFAEYQLTNEVVKTAQFGEIDGVLGTCGNGTTGNGYCLEPDMCCSAWGWCDDTEEHCKWDPMQLNIDGDTVVEVQYYCDSASSGWKYAAVGWNALLLLWASILAFQGRANRPEFNESQTLAFMIYSHLIFVILRLTTYGLSGNVKESMLSQIRSLIFSTDTMATMFIYFLPKLFAHNRGDGQSSSLYARGGSMEYLRQRYVAARRFVVSSVSFLNVDEDPWDRRQDETSRHPEPEELENTVAVEQNQSKSTPPPESAPQSNETCLTKKCPDCGTIVEFEPLLETTGYQSTGAPEDGEGTQYQDVDSTTQKFSDCSTECA